MALSQALTTAVTIWCPRTRWQVAGGRRRPLAAPWVGAVGCCRVWRAQPPRSPAQGAQACRPTCQRCVYRAAWHVEQHSRSTTWRGRPSSITPPTARVGKAKKTINDPCCMRGSQSPGEYRYRSSQLTSQRHVQCACNNLTIHAMYKLYLVGTVVSPAEPGPGASEPAQHCQAVNEAQ